MDYCFSVVRSMGVQLPVLLDQFAAHTQNVTYTYIIYLYRALFLQKGLNAITNYCHLNRKKKEHKIRKNKHELNFMRKKICFEKFLKTVSETASLMSVGSEFHRSGPRMEKALSPAER